MNRPRRRKAIPKRLRAVVALRQSGICACGCGEKLTPGFVMDHQPALELRDWDATAKDTIPPANDPDHLFGLTPACSIRKTSHPRGPHTSIDSDQHAIAKVRRITGQVGQNKRRRDWPSREMPRPREFKPTPAKRIDLL